MTNGEEKLGLGLEANGEEKLGLGLEACSGWSRVIRLPASTSEDTILLLHPISPRLSGFTI